MSVGTTVEFSPAVSVTVRRGTPWYRRRPKFLWEDLRRDATSRLRPIRAWISELLKRAAERMMVLLPGRSAAAGNAPLADYMEEWRFADTPWDGRGASDLVRAYLDKLEPIVREAEGAFSNTRRISGHNT